MKFIRCSIISLLMVMLVWPVSGSESGQAHAQATGGSHIPIYLDGALLASDTSPYIKAKENVTMVPLRVISEELGAQVEWSSAAKSATIQKDGHVLILGMGQQTAWVNGRAVSLDVSVENKNGRTMVPLRFVGENLGLNVHWDQTNKTISLTSNDMILIPQPVEPSEPAASSELRGAWISTVSNIDWPSKTSYGKADVQQQEYIKMLDELEGMGINTVFVQVRPAADAIYRSKLVPWSSFLTGTSGKDPGYDPLQFMIDETHRRGMEFHAWFNPFRASTGSDASKLPANHVANLHPEWIVKFGGKLYINPGIPEAREHIIETITEVVQGYNIDGVHLDDYFYPTGETSSAKFNDDLTFKQYNANKVSNKGDWRRDNINEFVRDLGTSVHQLKPELSYGISPFGVWRNQSDDPAGSDTRAGITAYDSTYADVRAWIKNEWIDYVVPQIYWSLSRKEVRYDIIADWWASQVRDTNVKLYIGHAPYKLGTQEVGWNSAHEILNQLEYNRKIPEIQGSIFFSAKDLIKNPLGLIPLLQTYYRNN